MKEEESEKEEVIDRLKILAKWRSVRTRVKREDERRKGHPIEEKSKRKKKQVMRMRRRSKDGRSMMKETGKSEDKRQSSM